MNAQLKPRPLGRSLSLKLDRISSSDEGGSSSSCDEYDDISSSDEAGSTTEMRKVVRNKDGQLRRLARSLSFSSALRRTNLSFQGLLKPRAKKAKKLKRVGTPEALIVLVHSTVIIPSCAHVACFPPLTGRKSGGKEFVCVALSDAASRTSDRARGDRGRGTPGPQARWRARWRARVPREEGYEPAEAAVARVDLRPARVAWFPLSEVLRV